MRAALLLCLLAGCVAEPLWVHPSKDAADFNADSYACEKDVAPVQQVERARAMAARCMESRGWHKKS